MPVPPRPDRRAPSRALAALLLLALVPGEALARRGAPPSPTPEPAVPGTTWTSSEPENAACQRSRRKLWQPAEGWVVRNVTVCR